MKNKKSLGQNWLTDRPTLETIADYTLELPEPALSPPDFCVEIGPGLGTLTSSLLRRFPTVLAIEKDETLAANLPKSFPGKNLIVKSQDFLDFNLNTGLAPYLSDNQTYVIVGNIPYYITTPIIKHLFSCSHLPQKIVLLVQEEFAQKITACSTPLGYYLFNLADLQQGITVPRSLFTPPPKVNSAVLILTPRIAPLYPNYTKLLASLISLAFAAPRKKLSTNLTPLTAKANTERALLRLNLNPSARPADLSLANYASLVKLLK